MPRALEGEEGVGAGSPSLVVLVVNTGCWVTMACAARRLGARVGGALERLTGSDALLVLTDVDVLAVAVGWVVSTSAISASLCALG